MIRRATPADIGAVARLGRAALEREAENDGLVIDDCKIMEIARLIVAAKQHYCYVSEVGNQVVGAVSAEVGEMTFFKRRQATVLQWYADQPGHTARLLRHFAGWVRERPGIKAVMLTTEAGDHPRVAEFLTRQLGWPMESHAVYFWTRSYNDV